MKMLCDTLPPMLVCALCLFADGLMETHGAARFLLAVGIVTALCIALQGIKKPSPLPWPASQTERGAEITDATSNI